MAIYQILVPVKKATGHQTFLVEAESENEALAKYEAGQASFEGEEIEVGSLGEPEVSILE